MLLQILDLVYIAWGTDWMGSGGPYVVGIMKLPRMVSLWRNANDTV